MGVVTQGIAADAQRKGWLTEFYLTFSKDNVVWEHQTVPCEGNSDGQSKAWVELEKTVKVSEWQHPLVVCRKPASPQGDTDCVLQARYIRLHAIAWGENPALRVGVFVVRLDPRPEPKRAGSCCFGVT